jgi:hypothetical protein
VGAILAGLVVSACGGGDPAPPRTTTVTVTPTAGTTSTSGRSGPPSTTTTTTAADRPPSTFDEATRLFATGTVDPAVQRIFTSPTGNIFCSVTTGGDVPAGCELKDGRIAAPADVCGGGTETGGVAKDIGRIEWSGGVPKAICNTDSIYQVGAFVLQYGAIATLQGSPYRCMSKEFGMTCIDTDSKQGFFLARNTYVTF